MGIKNGLVVFESKDIRRIWYDDEWFFSVVDVVGILSGTLRPRKYWADLKMKLIKEGNQLSDSIGQLKMEASDGKKYMTDCADLKGIFRIIQSIPSRKAEPFKLWLAKVGSDRVDEIDNPELAQERMKELYEKKGYSKDWIDKRIRGIAIRQNLTDEWKDRNVGKEKEYAILTNEITRATFGKDVSEYKKHKKLRGENLRDNMDDWELILTMIGEKATTEITREDDSSGFGECLDSAERGGEIAGRTRKDLEKSLKRSLVSSENYLGANEGRQGNKKIKMDEVRYEE